MAGQEVQLAGDDLRNRCCRCGKPVYEPAQTHAAPIATSFILPSRDQLFLSQRARRGQHGALWFSGHRRGVGSATTMAARHRHGHRPFHRSHCLLPHLSWRALALGYPRRACLRPCLGQSACHRLSAPSSPPRRCCGSNCNRSDEPFDRRYTPCWARACHRHAALRSA